MPTIYDIAKKAGVSPTTVSKVFNNYKDVSDRTKNKVLQIATEMGYVPNSTARSLKTNRSFLVGVVFSENVGIGLEHQFFSVVLESFRNTIGTFGYDTIFINKSLGNQPLGYLDHCKYRNVDGVFIITALPNDMDFSKLMSSGMKCVTTDILFNNSPYVISDNKEGAHMAVDYFMEMGHKRIAHLAGPLNVIAAEQRYNSFVAYTKEKQLSLDDRYLAISDNFNVDDAYKATVELYERFTKEDYPTAIFASADIIAIGAIRALKDMGYKVPEDVSIIGFDDIQLAEYTSPALTTIKQDKKLIGKKVAETLYQYMNDEPVESTVTPVSLVIRDSVRNLNAE